MAIHTGKKVSRSDLANSGAQYAVGIRIEISKKGKVTAPGVPSDDANLDGPELQQYELCVAAKGSFNRRIDALPETFAATIAQLGVHSIDLGCSVDQIDGNRKQLTVRLQRSLPKVRSSIANTRKKNVVMNCCVDGFTFLLYRGQVDKPEENLYSNQMALGKVPSLAPQEFNPAASPSPDDASAADQLAHLRERRDNVERKIAPLVAERDAIDQELQTLLREALEKTEATPILENVNEFLQTFGGVYVEEKQRARIRELVGRFTGKNKGYALLAKQSNGWERCRLSAPFAKGQKRFVLSNFDTGSRIGFGDRNVLPVGLAIVPHCELTSLLAPVAGARPEAEI